MDVLRTVYVTKGAEGVRQLQLPDLYRGVYAGILDGTRGDVLPADHQPTLHERVPFIIHNISRWSCAIGCCLLSARCHGKLLQRFCTTQQILGYTSSSRVCTGDSCVRGRQWRYLAAAVLPHTPPPACPMQPLLCDHFR